jgi:hypothetical protein
LSNKLLRAIPTTSYFDSLIDGFGIWQHSDGVNILREEGYALDDATRGLLFTLAFDRFEQSEILFSYILKSGVKNKFYGFADCNRNFIPGIASSDAIGQVIWAAGYAISKYFHSSEAKQSIIKVTPYMDKTKFMRGFAYALLGAIHVNKELAEHFYIKLKSYFDNVDDEWVWPDKTLTYGNGIIPYALLRYGLVYDDKTAVKLGRKVLIFLEKCCTRDRLRGPIGNDGWLSRGSDTVPIFSQQPIDAAYMVWAWLVMYQISGDVTDKKMYKLWMSWFEGENVLRTKMYDTTDMRCYDGIDYFGVHKNSGAESNICLLLSKYMTATKNTI